MGLASKILITLIVIDVMLVIGNIQTPEALTLAGSFITFNQTQNIVGLNSTFQNNSAPPSSGNVISQVANVLVVPIFFILNFLNLIFGILLAPVSLLTVIGAPFEIKVLIGGTLTVLYVIGIAGILSGRDI